MILTGNSLHVLPTLQAGYYHTCVTSPPYSALRDYGLPSSDWPEVTYTPMPGLPPITVPAWNGRLGLETTPEMFVAHIVLVFREVWRVLRDDGTLWLNFGAHMPAVRKDVTPTVGRIRVAFIGKAADKQAVQFPQENSSEGG